MAQTFDSTTKHLVETRPEDWLRLLGIEAAEIEICDADLSTVIAEADKVIQVLSPIPFLIDLDFQSGYDALLPDRAAGYSVLLTRRFGLSVLTILVLLRPKADSPAMTGVLEWRRPSG